MNAEERRLRNVERYEARVRQVNRIKRSIVIVALAIVVGIVAIAVSNTRKSTKVAQTAHADQNNILTSSSSAAATSSSSESQVPIVAESGSTEGSSTTAAAATSVSADGSSAASSSVSDAETGVFGSVGRAVAQAANEGEQAVNTVKYFWASTAGATEGSQDDPIPENDPSLQEGTEKIIYLTFDDGPGPYTEQLLEVLKNHNAKATFFVTNQFPQYQDLIKREAEEGHSIGVHTYQHDYQTLYSSSEAFWDDFEKMQQIIEEQTGYRTELMRFPGGSSNTISRFTPGIMTELTQEAEQKGYTFIDWNASSGDGESSSDYQSVLEKSEKECSYGDTSVLLCHDIKQSTVDAMDEFLTWGEENGYTFLPMSPHSLSCHQQLNN